MSSDMPFLDKIINQTVEPGMYLLSEYEYPYYLVAEEMEAHGWAHFHIDGREINSRNTYMDFASWAMKFPKKWWWRWSEFRNHMCDLSWTGEVKGFVVHYSEFHRYAYTDYDSFPNAYDILWDAIEHWRNTDTPMYILLNGDEDSLPPNMPQPVNPFEAQEAQED